MAAPNYTANTLAYQTLKTQHPTLITSPGWTLTSSPDKHGRTRPLQSGPPTFSHRIDPETTMRPDWLLRLSRDQPNTPIHVLLSTRPARCLDPLLLHLLSLAAGGTPTIFSPIESNPSSPQETSLFHNCRNKAHRHPSWWTHPYPR